MSANRIRSIPVTTTRNHDGMTKEAGLLVELNDCSIAELDPSDVEWTHKPAVLGRPEMWRGRYRGVEIWCKNIDPSIFDGRITGLLEIKLKRVTQHRPSGTGDEVSQYLYINVLPQAPQVPQGDGEKLYKKTIVRIVRPLRTRKGRRTLPHDFDDKTDYCTLRQGQPWQIIMVRDDDGS